MDPNDEMSSQWLSFQSWLNQQRDGESENIEQNDSPGSETTTEPASDQPSTSTSGPVDQQTPEHEQQPRQQGRPSSLSASLARDCRMETRLLDGHSRGRQDMTIMLAAPGMPLHKWPLISTRQASALLAALCEPLVQVSVGRMTRRLESPTMLRPTQDRGVLSLWLLPNDDLSLVWQGRAVGSPPSSESASSSSDAASEVVSGVEKAGCEVTVWEELARFPSGAHPGMNDPVITIHMLRGDASGRSFYIKPRADTTAAVAQHASNSAAGVPEVGFDGSEEGKRMYFWLTGQQLAPAVRSLGRLKSLVKRPPTLVKRSGVPQRHLNQIGSWLHQLDIVAHQQAAAMQSAVTAAAADSCTSAAAPVAAAPAPAAAAAATPGMGMAALLGRQGQTATQYARSMQLSGNSLGATGAVSATAAAVYRDRRFQISIPCTITIGASVILRGTPTVDDTEVAAKELTQRATQQAKQVAEDMARLTVDRIGRRNLEEAICESLIRSVRAQRAKAKADVQAQRDKQARQAQAQQAQPLIRKAVAHAVAKGGTPSHCCKVQMALQVAAAGTLVEASLEPSIQAHDHRCQKQQQEEEQPVAVATPPPAINSERWSECLSAETAGTGTSAADVEAPLSTASSASSPRRQRISNDVAADGEGDGDDMPNGADSAPAAGRVTIDDLQSLLNAGGPAPTAATGRSASGQVHINDLPELLQSHEQPSSHDR